MKNDALKKHHFWILAGLAPLLAVLAVVFLMSGAGGAASAALKEQEDKKKAVASIQPKGTQAIEDWGKQKEVLLAQREKLWQAAWEQQKLLFTWPGKEPELRAMEQRYPKFGTPMTARMSEFDLLVRRESYEDAYAEMARSVAPTTFASGSWRRVLRHVTNWGARTPTYQQVWLALEDMWVQRGLLQPVNTINDEARRFDPVGEPGKAAPFAAKYRNRIWDIELEIVPVVEGSRRGDAFKVRLTNRTDRLQLLGQANALPLEVTLGGRGQPILLRVEGGNFVKAGDTVELKPDLKGYGLPPGVAPAPITNVRLRLDGRTAPVRRVEAVELGYKDARHFPATLKNPEWWPEADPAAADPTAAGGTMTLPGGDGGAGSFGGPPGGVADVPGMTGMAGVAGGRRAGAKFGPPAAVLDGNKARYLDVTKQVRRMPVAVALVVDQMFVQDALSAYANSPLRFQVTQFHWKRYRGGAGAGGYGGDGSGGFPGGDFGAPGDVGSDDMRGGFSMPPGGDAAGFPGATGGGYSMPPGAGMAGLPDGGESSSYGYTLPSGGFPGTGGGTTGTQLAEGQDTSGLVELTIYGVVTLYEMFEKEKPADGETPPAGTPADATAEPATTDADETPKP